MNEFYLLRHFFFVGCKNFALENFIGIHLYLILFVTGLYNVCSIVFECKLLLLFRYLLYTYLSSYRIYFNVFLPVRVIFKVD